MPLNIPNILTLARIISIPFFVAAYLLLPGEMQRIAVTVIFVAASLTDMLDGYLARKLGMVSSFGTFLDPIADKLMVCTALVLLVSDSDVTRQIMFHGFFVLASIIIVGREVSVAAMREWMAEVGGQLRITTTMLSKIKTTLQMGAIVLLLYGQPIGTVSAFMVGEALLYVSAVLTLWTMVSYMRAAWPSFSEKVYGNRR